MYKSILIPVDVNEESSWRTVLKVAAAYFTSNAEKIHLVTVVPRDEGIGILSQFIPEGFEQEQIDIAKKKLEELSPLISVTPGQCERHVRTGNAYVEVLGLADLCKADLIVLSSHRPELKDYLLGPIAARILRHSNCSVFVIRN